MSALRSMRSMITGTTGCVALAMMLAAAPALAQTP
jgi:hypothetical protein